MLHHTFVVQVIAREGSAKRLPATSYAVIGNFSV